MGRKINFGGGIIALCVMSQFPEYSQQYVQRLGGAVDELRGVAADFDASASKVGMTRDAALGSMTGTEFLDSRRKDMTRSFARLYRLSEQYERLNGAGALTRLQSVAALDDRRIAMRAWDDFKPAVPLTREGALFAAIGFLGGFAGFAAIGRAFKWLRRKPAPAEALQ